MNKKERAPNSKVETMTKLWTGPVQIRLKTYTSYKEIPCKIGIDLENLKKCGVQFVN